MPVTPQDIQDATRLFTEEDALLSAAGVSRDAARAAYDAENAAYAEKTEEARPTEAIQATPEWRALRDAEVARKVAYDAMYDARGKLMQLKRAYFRGQ